VWAVEVEGLDVPGNKTTIGNKTDTEDFPTEDSIVFYTDSDLPAATVSPANGSSPTTQTPFFLVIDHTDEAAEYGLDAGGSMTDDAGLVDTDLDVHETVTLTAATLDGTDILSLFETQDDLTFTAAILDIGIGEHTLVFTAEDQAGNEIEDRTIVFTVKARSAYSVAVNAGWNLVSFPGTPVDTDIDTVFPPSHPATDVLSYDDGVWMVGTRSAGGTWEGTLANIDGQHGYWVNTTSSTPIKSLLAEPSVGSAATLPSIPIEQGWNLVAVIDLAQVKQDGAPGGPDSRTGATYFTSLDWAVAYTYNSATRVWTRITSTVGSVENGQGVWVWANADGTLIP
jgi:hypothetical protein